MYKTILGVETSCDETAAAVLSFEDSQDKQKGRIKVLSNIITSSASLQSKFGGIIPEQAAREQLKAIIPVVETALIEARKQLSYQAIKQKTSSSIAKSLNSFIANEIDAIAVTYGPGLIGSLLVGVETAKTLALTWNKPLIPVNHLLGHFYANWIGQGQESSIKYYGKKQQDPKSLAPEERSLNTYPLIHIPTFPIIGLLVSGGHTDLVLFTDHNQYQYLGGTRDDAAGECFDKCARLLGLPYPGGPEISKLAKKGDASKFKLPQPMVDSNDFDFSFSGLKTAVSNYVQSNEDYNKADLAAALEKTIIDVLVKKTWAAAEKHGINQVMIAGGVAANQALSEALRSNLHVNLLSPSHNIFCTDNAAMIAAAGFFAKETTDPLKLQANPNLSL